MKKNIIVFVGSNSSTSINKVIATQLALLSVHNTTIITMADVELPLFGQDREKLGIPEQAVALSAQFDDADGFVVATPEYNSSIPGYFKNGLDWLSRINKKVFRNKPVLLVNASPGARAGASVRGHLETILPYWGASSVISEGFGSYGDRVDENGNLSSEPDRQLLQSWIQELEAQL